MEIKVFSLGESIQCDCGGTAQATGAGTHDDDGPILDCTCLRCEREFKVQFEDEEEREITGDEDGQ